jgi:uncharacterized membrane protein YoaK (UPF0700 family)
MITRLPTWIWAGAWILALVAGMVNVVGLLGFEHQAITHLTGNTSLLAADIAGGNVPGAWQLFLLLGSFVVGAALSGLIIQDATLRLGRRYGVALLIVSALLCAAAILMSRHSVLGMYAAAIATGLQNAMASTYSGSVVRTTHVSGMFTDLGIGLGHALRGIGVDRRRMLLSVTVITGFFAGGIAGSILYSALGYAALYVPAGIAGLAGAGYAVMRWMRVEAVEAGR